MVCRLLWRGSLATFWMIAAWPLEDVGLIYMPSSLGGLEARIKKRSLSLARDIGETFLVTLQLSEPTGER